METLNFTVDILPGATVGTIDVDASANAFNTVTLLTESDPSADVPHQWTVIFNGPACFSMSPSATTETLDVTIGYTASSTTSPTATITPSPESPS